MVRCLMILAVPRTVRSKRGSVLVKRNPHPIVVLGFQFPHLTTVFAGAHVFIENHVPYMVMFTG